METKISNLHVPFIDTSKVLYTQSAKEFTFTAIQDCILAGTMETSGTAAATIYINNIRVGGCYSAANSITASIFLPLKKGQVLRYESNHFNSAYPMHIFGLLS